MNGSIIDKLRAIHLGDARTFVWFFVGIALVGTYGLVQVSALQTSVVVQAQALRDTTSGQLSHVLTLLRAFDEARTAAEQEGVDVASVLSLRAAVVAEISAGSYAEAASDVRGLAHQLQALRDAKRVADEASRPSAVIGKVTTAAGTAISQVVLELKNDATTVTATTDVAGAYQLSAPAGTYTLKASKTGYVTKEHADVILAAGGTQTIDISLSAASSASSKSATSSGSSSGSSGGSASTSDGVSSYVQKTVATSRGDFTAHVMTFNLGGGVKVRTATGNDEDCSNNCVVKSLMSYVNEEGGASGINGTYFCPAEYSSCAGQTGYFFWKVYKTSQGKLINATNNLGHNDPMIAFTSSGHVQYYSAWHQWSDSGAAASTYAGINSKPRLVEGGVNVLNEGSLDSNQQSVKGNRGALGLSGQTLYAVIVKSATVPDLAAVMDALDVENAMNIDGGGSSAMVYKGSYKVGPGRQIPNALVIVH